VRRAAEQSGAVAVLKHVFDRRGDGTQQDHCSEQSKEPASREATQGFHPLAW
jgi:hypothetical protein